MWRRRRVTGVGIFGSILHTDSPNDIDILVKGYRDPLDLEAFRDELEELTGMRVDVVIEKYANPIILYRAKKEIRYVA